MSEIDYRELGVDREDYERKRRLRNLRDELVSQFNSYDEYFKFMAALDKEVTQNLNKDLDGKPRLDSAMFFDTVCYLLENKPTPKEAFAYTAELYDKDDDWMKIAKNAQLRPYIHKEVTVEVFNKDIKTITAITNNDLDLKTAMVSSKTPNQSVRRIHKLIKVSDRLDNLESRVGNIEKRQDVAEYLLKAVVEMSCKDALKLEAKRLILEGNLSRKEIAEVTGVSIRTLANYAKEVKEEKGNT